MRIRIYDKVKAEESEKGIYEVSLKGKKVYSIVTILKKKLDP